MTKTLPPSRLGVGGYASWCVLILPYVEQAPLYDQWDLTQTYYLQTAAAAQTAPRSGGVLLPVAAGRPEP